MADEVATETKPSPTTTTTARTPTKTKIKNEKEGEGGKDEDSFDEQIDYKQKYRSLKRKLKSLLYEQECFNEELRKTQRKCLRVSRDKSFLLDRLLQYETPELSSDDEATDSSSEDDVVERRGGQQSSGSKKSSVTGGSNKTNKTTKSAAISKNATVAGGGDKIRCKHIDEKSGKQCSKLVSKKIASATCQTHRQQIISTNNNIKSPIRTKTPPPPAVEKETPDAENNTPKRPPTGGKDIGQFREAMEASSQQQVEGEDSDNNSNSSNNVEEDELIIDVP